MARREKTRPCEDGTLDALQGRIAQLEEAARILQAEFSALQERVLRGERLMMRMQMEQLRTARTLRDVVQKLNAAG